MQYRYTTLTLVAASMLSTTVLGAAIPKPDSHISEEGNKDNRNVLEFTSLPLEPEISGEPDFDPSRKVYVPWGVPIYPGTEDNRKYIDPESLPKDVPDIIEPVKPGTGHNYDPWLWSHRELPDRPEFPKYQPPIDTSENYIDPASIPGGLPEVVDTDTTDRFGSNSFPSGASPQANTFDPFKEYGLPPLAITPVVMSPEEKSAFNNIVNVTPSNIERRAPRDYDSHGIYWDDRWGPDIPLEKAHDDLGEEVDIFAAVDPKTIREGGKYHSDLVDGNTHAQDEEFMRKMDEHFGEYPTPKGMKEWVFHQAWVTKHCTGGEPGRDRFEADFPGDDLTPSGNW